MAFSFNGDSFCDVICAPYKVISQVFIAQTYCEIIVHIWKIEAFPV